jgi:hypothetical protein
MMVCKFLFKEKIAMKKPKFEEKEVARWINNLSDQAFIAFFFGEAAKQRLEIPTIDLKNNMARPEGFEPPTNGFGSHYSIRLSYGRSCEW